MELIRQLSDPDLCKLCIGSGWRTLGFGREDSSLYSPWSRRPVLEMPRSSFSCDTDTSELHAAAQARYLCHAGETITSAV